MKRRQILRSGKVVNAFDPWGNPLCTCPPKYSLNPYTGCSHFCLYCYATSYIGRKPSTPKKNYKERLLYDIAHVIDPRFHIDMSTSSDPYPPEEAKYKLTRWSLEQLLPLGFKVLIITKGSLVARDAKLLASGNAAVTMTITTLDETLARRLEPGAPSPRDRILALKRLNEEGVPVGIRLDPVFPLLTDSEENISEVLEAARAAGARFVVTSTYKAKPDNYKRMLEAFPELRQKYDELYKIRGERLYGYRYLPLEIRKEILLRVRKIALRLGMEYATCREGFPNLHTAPTCDGSHLIPLRIRARITRKSSRTLNEFINKE
ncbi:SPL family radical SAM protein [Pyrofollis japonicus]|uniref:SPL family radical SAM protein n=1 Tax=Pyrofollis japonicus TaxID=3060460 RepID=UPI00295A6A86|nr:radical SAM protein [Pyrofollis japonicus]